MPNPKLMPEAFCNDGLKNDIPETRASGVAENAITYADGFPQITMTPVAAGGKPPSGKDMNGILHEISQHIVHLNKGNMYQFDTAFANKIGGYPKGSVLISDKLDALFLSLVNNNKTNFNTASYTGKWLKFASPVVNNLTTDDTDKPLSAAMGQKLNQEKLGNSGNQTLTDGMLVVKSTKANANARFALLGTGDGWLAEVGASGDLIFTRRDGADIYSAAGNRAVYKMPSGTGTHVLATESQIGFVKPGIKPATSEIIDLTKKSEILAYAGTSGNKHIQLTFYNNASSQIVGLPIEDKSPCQMDISIMGTYTVCRVYYFYLRREFVSSVNWNSEELSYHWDETANKNTAVMLAGNQDVAGNKKFLGRTEFAGGVKMTNDTRSVEVGVGSNDVYIGNLTTRKFVQLKDDGTLAYSNVKIMLASDKSDAVDLDDTNKLATAKAVKIVNDKVDRATPPGTVAYFAGRNAPAGWLKANGTAVSRTIYADLFAAIGTTYGAGDGRTTFNLPDLRGEFVRGFDDGRNIDRSRALGSAQADDIKAHNHMMPSGEQGSPSSWDLAVYGIAKNQTSTRVEDFGSGVQSSIRHLTSNTGGTETRPRNVALLACIKI